MSNPNEVPSATEYGQLIAYMSRNGMTSQAAKSVLGDSPNGRTRAEITDELRVWLKASPKA